MVTIAPVRHVRHECRWLHLEEHPTAFYDVARAAAVAGGSFAGAEEVRGRGRMRHHLLATATETALRKLLDFPVGNRLKLHRKGLEIPQTQPRFSSSSLILAMDGDGELGQRNRNIHHLIGLLRHQRFLKPFIGVLFKFIHMPRRSPNKNLIEVKLHV